MNNQGRFVSTEMCVWFHILYQIYFACKFLYSLTSVVACVSTCRYGPEFVYAMDPETCESSFDNNDNILQFATGSIRPTLEYLLWIYII